MPVVIPDGYKPLLLPETVELAFSTVRRTGERWLEAVHMRHVAPPVLVKSTGRSGEIRVNCRGIADELALPVDLEDWKRRRMKAYGIGAGYGLYTYTVVIDPDSAPDNVAGPVSDRWHYIRSLEPEQMTVQTLCDVAEGMYSLLKTVEGEVHSQFPHIPAMLPAHMAVMRILPENSDLKHVVREHKAFSMINEEKMSADVYVWNDIVGTEIRIASMCLADGAVSGWICPSLIAMQLLRLSALQDLFPLP